MKTVLYRLIMVALTVVITGRCVYAIVTLPIYQAKESAQTFFCVTTAHKEAASKACDRSMSREES